MRTEEGMLQPTVLLTNEEAGSHCTPQERRLRRWPYEVDPITYDEIHSHIKDAEWQRLRLAMKGVHTGRKLAMCEDYMLGHIVKLPDGSTIDSAVLHKPDVHHRCVVVINYINALKRGGQLNSLTLEVRR